MHELLRRRDPARTGRIGLPESIDACRRFAASRWRGWRWAAPLLPRDAREDLAIACAWHRLVRELGELGEAPRPSGAEPPGAPGASGAPELEAAAAEVEALGTRAPTTLIGRGLEHLVERYRVPPLLLLRPLRAVRRAAHVHAYQTRAELLAHAAELAHPEARLALRILATPTERNELLADALGTGLQLTRWIVGLRGDLARGRLLLPVEDLARHGVALADLAAPSASPDLRRCIADEVAWARGFLVKGWPLCDADPLRGRALAFLLHWHAASLAALERRGHDPLAGPPPAGLGRAAACLAASLAGRGTALARG